MTKALDAGSEECRELATNLYLAELAPCSRSSQSGALRAWAKACGTVDWPALALLAPAQLRAWADAGLAPATLRTRAAALTGVLRQLWRLGAIDGDQFERLRPRAPSGSRLPRGRALDARQVLALRTAADASPLGLRDAATVALLYGAGLRRAEACALELEQLEQTPDGPQLRVHGKGGKERLVPLPPAVAAELRAWLDWRGEGPGPLLCHAYERCPLSPGQLARRVRDLARRAGLGEVRPHDLRRSYVSALLEARADVLMVARLVGHASPATTARYDLRSAREARSAALRLPY